MSITQITCLSIYIFCLGDQYDDVAQKAWEEVGLIEKEQEKYAELRVVAQRDLDNCKNKAIQLEKVGYYVIHQ